jgi:hypothetical protein
MCWGLIGPLFGILVVILPDQTRKISWTIYLTPRRAALRYRNGVNPAVMALVRR